MKAVITFIALAGAAQAQCPDGDHVCLVEAATAAGIEALQASQKLMEKFPKGGNIIQESIDAGAEAHQATDTIAEKFAQYKQQKDTDDDLFESLSAKLQSLESLAASLKMPESMHQ